MKNNGLDITMLENWLWEAACKTREEVDAPEYKDYILPLIFLKRLSDRIYLGGTQVETDKARAKLPSWSKHKGGQHPESD